MTTAPAAVGPWAHADPTHVGLESLLGDAVPLTPLPESPRAQQQQSSPRAAKCDHARGAEPAAPVRAARDPLAQACGMSEKQWTAEQVFAGRLLRARRVRRAAPLPAMHSFRAQPPQHPAMPRVFSSSKQPFSGMESQSVFRLYPELGASRATCSTPAALAPAHLHTRAAGPAADRPPPAPPVLVTPRLPSIGMGRWPFAVSPRDPRVRCDPLPALHHVPGQPRVRRPRKPRDYAIPESATSGHAGPAHATLSRGMTSKHTLGTFAAASTAALPPPPSAVVAPAHELDEREPYARDAAAPTPPPLAFGTDLTYTPRARTSMPHMGAPESQGPSLVLSRQPHPPPAQRGAARPSRDIARRVMHLNHRLSSALLPVRALPPAVPRRGRRPRRSRRHAVPALVVPAALEPAESGWSVSEAGGGGGAQLS